jgi:hypothetical protein
VFSSATVIRAPVQTPARLVIHQTLADQDLQRLADRDRADAEQRRDLAERDRHARRGVAGEDHPGSSSRIVRGPAVPAARPSCTASADGGRDGR